MMLAGNNSTNKNLEKQTSQLLTLFSQNFVVVVVGGCMGD